MLIKQRKVRRSSKFTSKWKHSGGKRREYVASFYATASIQGVLVFFLLMGAYRTLEIMRVKAPDLAWYLKYAVPLFVLALAFLVLRLFIGNIRQIRNIYRERQSPPS